PHRILGVLLIRGRLFFAAAKRHGPSAHYFYRRSPGTEDAPRLYLCRGNRLRGRVFLRLCWSLSTKKVGTLPRAALRERDISSSATLNTTSRGDPFFPTTRKPEQQVHNIVDPVCLFFARHFFEARAYRELRPAVGIAILVKYG